MEAIYTVFTIITIILNICFLVHCVAVGEFNKFADIEDYDLSDYLVLLLGFCATIFLAFLWPIEYILCGLVIIIKKYKKYLDNKED